MKAVRLLLGLRPLEPPPGVRQVFPEFADPGDGDKTGVGLSRRVQGLLPGSIVSSESECIAESSSESSKQNFADCKAFFFFIKI